MKILYDLQEVLFATVNSMTSDPDGVVLSAIFGDIDVLELSQIGLKYVSGMNFY